MLYVTQERIEQLKLAKIWKEKWVKREQYYHTEMLKEVAKLNKEEEDKIKKAYDTNQLFIKAQNEQVCDKMPQVILYICSFTRQILVHGYKTMIINHYMAFIQITMLEECSRFQKIVLIL